MNVAWIHNTLPDTGTALLPGEHAGGGEMADAGIIAHAPYGVDVTMVAAHQWEKALGFDRIVIAGTESLPPESRAPLAARKPIVWVHHMQARTPENASLFAGASVFACMSAQHAYVETLWSKVPAVWCHGWIDPDDVAPAEKTIDALWAARNHPQKGLIGARMWAMTHGRTITEITGVPRETVLDAMSHAGTFVFLPKGFDSCPRTLIEAELAGCEIVTNAQAGRRDAGDIRDVLLAQPGKFWGWL